VPCLGSNILCSSGSVPAAYNYAGHAGVREVISNEHILAISLTIPEEYSEYTMSAVGPPCRGYIYTGSRAVEAAQV